MPSSRSLGAALRLFAIGAVVAIVGAGLVAVIGGGKMAAHRPPASVQVALPAPPRPAPALPSEAALPPPPAPAIGPGLPPATHGGDQAAWRKLAVVTPPVGARPLIAIVIDDMGLDRKRSARAVALPAPLTLSWLPYAQELGAQAASGRAAGHEILLHAPMQPQGHENPGPHALTTDLSAEEIHRRLAADLALLPEAVGLNNHMGSLFTRDARAMAPVIEELKRRGLLFLDSRTSGGSIGAALAREAGLPYAERDVFLDNEPTVDAVRARLAEVEGIARRRGVAVAIGHPHDATLTALEAWLPTLAAHGFAQVPISAIVQYRLDHPVATAARG